MTDLYKLYKPIALLLALVFFITLGVHYVYNPIRIRRQPRPPVQLVPLEEPKTNVEAVSNFNSSVSKRILEKNEKEYWTNVIAR